MLTVKELYHATNLKGRILLVYVYTDVYGVKSTQEKRYDKASDLIYDFVCIGNYNITSIEPGNGMLVLNIENP